MFAICRPLASGRVISRQLAMLCVLGVSVAAGACSEESTSANAGAGAAPPAGAGAAPAAAAGTYEGYLEKMSCDMLRGWAFDASHPDRALTIELYDGDRLLKTVVAEQFRQDLLDGKKGNGRHLFIESPPAELKDGKPHSIRAVIKGTSYALRPLADTPPSMTCAP